MQRWRGGIPGKTRREYQKKDSRSAKGMKEHQEQPFPDPSTVRECSNQGRKSCEQRVDHSQNRQQNPESGHTILSMDKKPE